MTGTGTTGIEALAAGRGRLVAAFLVVALLLCHGAFGVLHLSHPCDPCDPPPAAAAEASGAHHHAASQHGAAGDDGKSSGFSAHGLGGSGYFAVALALLGAAATAVLGMLLGVARGLVVAAFSRSHRPLHPPLADLLPRGPTLPLLQVFRL